ncbi:MAG TPA: serine hydrolase domain-containing protein [Alcanivoracaceae bacterium]|nr:serine hydrolase domain-containing protein [Alcanivoracaceae bacterium]
MPYSLQRLRYALPTFSKPPEDIGIEMHSSALSTNGKEQIWKAQRRLYATGMHPAISVHLHHRGQPVYHRALGFKDAKKQQPINLNTPICLFSASKAVTSILIHHLMTEGALDVNKPVAHYLPDYGQNGKHRTTIEHLLTHRAGVARPPKDAPIETLFQHEEILRRLYEAEPSKPGREQAYHAVTAGFILGEIITTVTGKSLNDYLTEVIRAPMGMTYFHYGMPAGTERTAAENVATGLPSMLFNRFLYHAVGTGLETVVDISNSDDYKRIVVPAGNLYATAEETSRFFNMLLANGRDGDKQILAPETVHRATRPTGKGTRLDRSLYLPLEFSSGFMLGKEVLSLYGPGTEDAFGHLGFLSIYGWADPQRELAGAILTTGKGMLGASLPFLFALQMKINQWAAH